jgi:hypothetical protein
MRYAGNVECMRGMRNICTISVRKPEKNRKFGRTLRRWKNNIQMYLKK